MRRARISRERLQSAYGTCASRDPCVVMAVVNAVAARCRNKFLAIFCRAGSAELTEHPRKVLLRLETTRDGDVQNASLRGTQHFFAALYPSAQDEPMRALPSRFSKHL